MPKKKKKPTRKAKKNPVRVAKRSRAKAPARKKSAAKAHRRKAGTLAVEVTEVDIITGIEENSIDERESSILDPMDEHFPPDYGGSE